MTSILKVSEIQDPANNNSALTIDSTGRVKTPARPFIQLFRNANASYAANALITDWRVNDSRGITISGGVMTVPVAGLYQIGIHVITSSTAGIHLYINDTKIYRIGYASLGTSESWSHVGGTGLFNLSADDEVRFKASNQTLQIYGTTDNETVGGAFVYLLDSNMSRARDFADLGSSVDTGGLTGRNLFINGAMQVAQRGTSSTATGMKTVDRFEVTFSNTDQLAVTQSQSTTVPSGQGFSNSLKVEVTTAETTLDSNEFFRIIQRIEAQNLQHLAFGSSSAKPLTLSFGCVVVLQENTVFCFSVETPVPLEQYPKLYHQCG